MWENDETLENPAVPSARTGHRIGSQNVNDIVEVELREICWILKKVNVFSREKFVEPL